MVKNSFHSFIISNDSYEIHDIPYINGLLVGYFGMCVNRLGYRRVDGGLPRVRVLRAARVCARQLRQQVELQCCCFTLGMDAPAHYLYTVVQKLAFS